MTDAMAAFGIAVAGTSLVCYALMARARRTKRRDNSTDGGGYSGSDGWAAASWFGGDRSATDSSGNPSDFGGDSGGGGDGGGGAD